MKKTKADSNFIISGLMVTAFAVIMGLLYDYFFDLNDDVLMKDIIAGVFTGNPEGHNIQMQYPISFVLSLFYKAIRGFDWYGLFLMLCQYISVFIIIRFVTKRADNNKRVFLASLGMLTCAAGLMPGHFLFVQYTFTVALLCAATAVLAAEGKRVSTVVLVVLAYLIRSEMTFLMLPFVFLVVVYCIIEDFHKKEKLQSLSRIMLGIAVGIFIASLLNNIAYSNEGWRNFTSFFDSRTEIYDFYGVPDYEQHKDFYEELGLDESEYELLVNYNFGLDEEINHETMGRIAEYAARVNAREPLADRILAVIPKYIYELKSVSLPKAYEYPMTYAPWNIIAGILYLAVLFSYLMNLKYGETVAKRFIAGLWRVCLLFAGRSSLWLYILVRGRDPIRITHSLFLMEIVVLMILLIHTSESDVPAGDATKEDNFVQTPHRGRVVLVICALASAVFVPSQVMAVTKEYQGRIEYNKAYEELEEYFRDHEADFFFEDVYTSVSYDGSGYSYSKKMFEDVDNSPANWTLLGGWASKSPAEKDKLKFFGLPESIEEALIKSDNTYVVTLKEDDMAWFFDYYYDKGIDIDIERTTEVADIFAIWKVKEAE